MKNKRARAQRSSIKKAMTAAALVAVMAFFYRCHGGDNTPVLPDTVTFHGHILPLFNAHCSTPGCHSGGSPSGNLNLSDSLAYDRLFAKHEIDTLNPPKSFLYIQMNSVGTPMPPTGRLGDYEVALVLKWIEQGAKNN